MDIVGDPRTYNEVYLYEELMETDLAAIIRYTRHHSHLSYYLS
jgi:hypothetical protein